MGYNYRKDEHAANRVRCGPRNRTLRSSTHPERRYVFRGPAAGAVLHRIRLIGLVLARWGGAWDIRGLDDWASLPVLMFLLSLFLFITNPIGSAFSRHLEHQADQYGLEVTHGLTPNSGQIAAQAFQILGEVDLADPDPNPANVFLFYDHPPISDRVRYSLDYDPWSNVGEEQF